MIKSTTALLLVLTNMMIVASSSFSIGFSRSTRTKYTSHAKLRVTRDEYLQPHFVGPSVAVDMDRIVHCAESNGLCSMEDMALMIDELDRLNESASSSSLDDQKVLDRAVPARAALQHSLQSQIDWMAAKQELEDQKRVLKQWKSNSEEDNDAAGHSFKYHVDYRAIAEYESH